MSPHQAKQALRVANVPADDFERQVESANPPTISALALQGIKPAPKPVIDLHGRDPHEFNRGALQIVLSEDALQGVLILLGDDGGTRLRKSTLNLPAGDAPG